MINLSIQKEYLYFILFISTFYIYWSVAKFLWKLIVTPNTTYSRSKQWIPACHASDYTRNSFEAFSFLILKSKILLYYWIILTDE